MGAQGLKSGTFFLREDEEDEEEDLQSSRGGEVSFPLYSARS